MDFVSVRRCAPLYCSFAFLFSTAFLSLNVASPAQAVTLKYGDIVVATEAAFEDGTRLERVDPLTGERELISAQGPDNLWLTWDRLARGADGSILMAAMSDHQVLRFDPATGARTVFSNSGHGNPPVGSGAALWLPTGIAVESSGDVLAAGLGLIVRIDPATGDRTLVSGTAPGTEGLPLRGDGPRSGWGMGLTVESPTTALIFGSDNNTLLRVDLTNGDRELVSGPTRGTGPIGDSDFSDLVITRSGQIVAVATNDSDPSFLVRIDPISGDRELIPNSEFANQWPTIDELPSGQLAIADYQGIILLDPVTGDRELLVELDPFALENLGDIMVYVPEPATYVMALVGAAFLGLVTRKRLKPSLRVILLVGMAATVMLGAASPAQAVTLRNGDIVVSATSDGSRLIKVDRETGDRAVLADGSQGSGPSITATPGIVQDIDGSILLTTGFGGGDGVYRVDPATGNRTIVTATPHSETPVGEGPELNLPLSLAVDGNGRALVIATGGLFGVDLATGNREFVSGFNVGEFSTRGEGPELDFDSFGLLLDGPHHALAFGKNTNLLRVDLATGDRELVSSAERGAGPIGDDPFRHLVRTRAGDILTTTYLDDDVASILRIDPITGDRVLVAQVDFPIRALAEFPTGELVLAGENWIHLLDPLTGESRVLSDPTHGSGIELMYPWGMMVYVPEPSTYVMALVGAAFFGVVARKRAKRSQRALVLVGVGVTVLAATSPAQAVTLKYGDIVAAGSNAESYAIFKVDRTTGERTLISGAARGTGPGLPGLQGQMAREADGSILIADPVFSRLLRIDPKTGNRSVVSESSFIGTPVGAGPSFDVPFSIVVEPNGNLLVTDHGKLFRVDPISGDRILVSGVGPALKSHQNTGLELESANHVLTFGDDVDLLQVDLATGDRQLVSSAERGVGPIGENLGHLLRTTAGEIFAATTIEGVANILRIDSLTGDRQLVPDSAFAGIRGMAELPTGELVIAGLGTLELLDPLTGQRTPLFDPTNAGGYEAWGVMVYVPEPSTYVMALVGAAFLGISARRRAKRALRQLCMVGVAATVMLGATSPAQAVTLKYGDIVVAGTSAEGTDIILRVDPATGDRTLISGAGRGEGPDFESTLGWGMAADRNGTILLPDSDQQTLLRIDPATGNRTIVSSSGFFGPQVGSGASLVYPNYPVQLPDGDWLVSSQQSVLRIDPFTGDRTLVSGEDVHSGSSPNPSRGAGPALAGVVTGLSLESASQAVAVGEGGNALVRIDLASGDRELITGPSRGVGPLGNVFNVWMTHEGQMWAVVKNQSVPSSNSILIQVDPLTGDRNQIATVSSPAIAELPDGKLVVSDYSSVKLFDPTSGEWSVLSDATHGTGYEFAMVNRVMVYVPEPSTYFMALVGAAFLGFVARKRAKCAVR